MDWTVIIAVGMSVSGVLTMFFTLQTMLGALIREIRVIGLNTDRIALHLADEARERQQQRDRERLGQW